MKSAILDAAAAKLNRALLFVTLIVVAGCGGTASFYDSTEGAPSADLSGNLHGGQWPIAGSAIQLYAAGDTGFGAGAQALLSQPVNTDPNGNFFIQAGAYHCPSASSELYLTSIGGDPGLGPGITNRAIELMAALGPCSGLGAIHFVDMNEISTVATVGALAPYMGYGAQVGSEPSAMKGLEASFASVNELVNISKGTTPGSSVPAKTSIPVKEINTLANILASCINSNGTGIECGDLFTDAAPPDGTAPTNTLDAILDIFLNSGHNVDALFSLPTPNAPFEPTLPAPPTRWSLGSEFTTNPLPAISSLVPATVKAGSGSQDLVVKGGGFSSSSTVTFNSKTRNVKSVSPGQLTIVLTPADVSKAGSYPVVVTNPAPGGGSSEPATLTVTQ